MIFFHIRVVIFNFRFKLHSPKNYEKNKKSFITQVDKGLKWGTLSNIYNVAFCENCYCCFGKLKLFSQYQLFTFSTPLKKSVFFTPEIFIEYKNV